MRQNTALISVPELLTLSTNQRIILLDASIPPIGTKPEDVVKETIPGAIFFDIEKQFSDPTIPLPHTLVTPEIFELKARALGIDKDSIIVVFDGYGIYSAPRAWWMFKIMGHEQVYVLNGGLPAWKKAGKETTTHFETINLERTTKSGDFCANVKTEFLTSKEQILNQLNDQKFMIVDARSSARFNGQVEEPRAGLRKGHISGSKNIPFPSCVENGFLKNASALKELIEPISKEPEKEIIFSCGSGITACVPLLAFYELGFRNLSLYDGSWAEWGADLNCPIELSKETSSNK